MSAAADRLRAQNLARPSRATWCRCGDIGVDHEATVSADGRLIGRCVLCQCEAFEAAKASA